MMTLSIKIRFAIACFLVFLALLVTLFCDAQAQTFTHVVLLIQENRAPDNLFALSAIPGADTSCIGSPIPLAGGSDLDHSHAAFLADQQGNWQAGAENCVEADSVEAYAQIARQYGFANRMFQSNQGPSYAAHQFLFGATSNVTADPTSDFAAENATGLGGNVGCSYSLSLVEAIDRNGNESAVWPCFERPVLPDEIAAAGLTWRYYTPSLGSIWTAPNSIEHICKPTRSALPQCTSPAWMNVITPQTQILNDISAGTLASLSWVIPSGDCSDHAGSNTGCGPSWVASIVNAIGQSAYWQNTLILILWDDWGGWQDHVPALANATGFCESYCYGFRVPMMVVCGNCESYASNVPMDFGSVIQFIEQNFSLASLGYADAVAQPFDQGFFAQPSTGRRRFVKIKSRPMTRQEFADRGDPDND